MNTRCCQWFAGLLALMLLLSASPAEAARPPRDPPPPPPAIDGTIFFKYGGDIWKIDSSGVSKVMDQAVWQPVVNADDPDAIVLITHSDPVVSSWRYPVFAGQHLWLNEEHLLDSAGNIVGETDQYGVTRARRELFLFTPDRSAPTDRMPLLVSLPDGRLSDLYALGIVPYSSNAQERRICWSNDGLDTFISFVGTDRIESGPNDPNNPQNIQNWTYKRYIYQFPLVWLNGTPYLEFQGMCRLSLGGDVITSGIDWAPDGQTVVYEHVNEIYTHRVGDQLPTRISVNGDCPAWSPDRDADQTGDQCRVAFTARHLNYYNDQISVNPDGSGSVTVAELRADVNTENCWQPFDGSSIAILQSEYQRKTWSWLHDIAIIPSGGGTPVNLTSTLDRAVYKHIIAWRHGIELP